MDKGIGFKKKIYFYFFYCKNHGPTATAQQLIFILDLTRLAFSFSETAAYFPNHDNKHINLEKSTHTNIK